MAHTLPLRPGAPLISEQFKQNMELWKSNHFLSLPNELVNEVASYLDDPQDIFNLRLTSLRLSAVQQPWFFCMLTKHKNIYSRADEDVMDKINTDHYNEVNNNNNGAFLTGGGFRSMLIAILAECPNLKVIIVRKIKPDEHIPGWIDTDIFKKLSFDRPGLHYKGIFYNDWKYDTKHFRVTQYVDEFGDVVSEDDVGPQASFKDDVEAAVSTSVNDVKVNYTD